MFFFFHLHFICNFFSTLYYCQNKSIIVFKETTMVKYSGSFLKCFFVVCFAVLHDVALFLLFLQKQFLSKKLQKLCIFFALLPRVIFTYFIKRHRFNTYRLLKKNSACFSNNFRKTFIGFETDYVTNQLNQ